MKSSKYATSISINDTRLSTSASPVKKFGWGLVILLLAVCQNSLAAIATDSGKSTTTTTTLASTSNGTSHGQISNSNATTTSVPKKDNPSAANCPSSCSCSFHPTSHHLKISCDGPKSLASTSSAGSFSKGAAGTVAVTKLDFFIKQLTITNAVVDDIKLAEISQTVLENNLQEVTLLSATIDPLMFLSSDLLRLSSRSLRKLSFLEIKSVSEGYGKYGSQAFKLPYGAKFKYLMAMEHLESLTLIDCDPYFSNMLMKSLPLVRDLTIAKSSVDSLEPEYFSHMTQLRTLNLSHNQIPSIPYGMAKYLPHLKVLDLTHNVIEHLQEEVFVGLEALEVLTVRYNKIRYVDTEVFNPLKAVELIDLSHNEIIQIFEPYFEENKKLKVLLMSNSWSWHSFLDEYKGTRSFHEMEKLLATLSSVEILDLSDNEMITIPETLAHAPLLKRVSLEGNPWQCTCQDRWVEQWIRTTDVAIVQDEIMSTVFCHSSNKVLHPEPIPIADSMKSLNCSDHNINVRTRIKYYGVLGESATLKCHVHRHNGPTVTWVTPRKQQVVYVEPKVHVVEDDNQTGSTDFAEPNLMVDEGGNLLIETLSLEDYGLYLCIASYPDLVLTHYVHLGMDTSIFLEVKMMSIFVGLMTSFCFLMTVLLIQFVRLMLGKCGIDFMATSAPSRTLRVRAFFQSIEQNNLSQMDWLKDNYNMQAKRIRDNCLSQLERIRESYTSQTKNLSDIKYYGAQQLHTIRDQYNDQIRRVSSYSSQHLCKVRENYVFQRNRVSKFSSHQLLRLRETYKWQAQTVNKLLENLPKTLNFDTCRGMGACGRTDSMYFDESGELRPLEVVIESDGRHRHVSGMDKMENVSLLIPPQMHRLGDTFHPRFILPQHLEATELVVVVAKPSTSASAVIANRDDPPCGVGAVNECVVLDEDDRRALRRLTGTVTGVVELEKIEEESQNGGQDQGGGDANC